MKEVNYYLEEILRKTLISLGIKSNDSIINNVRMQITSLLYHWNDEDVRNTILFLGNEEAIFYDSRASLNIKSFVVMAIRNSLIETAGSVSYYTLGFENQIKDMKLITSQAISYFEKLDLKELSYSIEKPIDDYYMESINRYYNAFNLLNRLSKLNSKEERFEKDNIIKCSNLSLNYISPYISDEKVIEDGYIKEPTIRLKQSLQIVINNNVPFFVDSFKVISRNFERLLRIIQFLLENDCPFVTCNYYISNGYISKRLKLLRPMHSNKDFILKLRNETGISDKHRQELKRQRKIFSNN